ncbi:hypothetical protein FE634_02655 [Nocardioides dongxiaopingii]|uniref:hypothetical protein n=1 Tax=Nocardioides sp. S-1144 TaxID=2582905 RepID=UPI00110D6152|nr:hypothetical protein [Nocardioides sp. S-1144]QCW49586.1 hypothetical protein FE634_02655 [Nocardioides sp. S-1144]
MAFSRPDDDVVVAGGAQLPRPGQFRGAELSDPRRLHGWGRCQGGTVALARNCRDLATSTAPT